MCPVRDDVCAWRRLSRLQLSQHASALPPAALGARCPKARRAAACVGRPLRPAQLADRGACCAHQAAQTLRPLSTLWMELRCGHLRALALCAIHADAACYRGDAHRAGGRRAATAGPVAIRWQLPSRTAAAQRCAWCGTHSTSGTRRRTSVTSSVCAGLVVGRQPVVELLLFVAADAASAVLLYRLAQAYTLRQASIRFPTLLQTGPPSNACARTAQLSLRKAARSGKVPPEEHGDPASPWACALLFLWSPCAIAACVGCARAAAAGLGAGR